MSPLYLLLLCLTITNARKLKDEISHLLSSLDHEGLKTKGTIGDVDDALSSSHSPDLSVSSPDLGLTAPLSEGHDWLDAIRHQIKHKVSKLNAALEEIEHAHNNLKPVPVSVERKAHPVQAFDSNLEDLISDSEIKLSKLKALSKFRASKLETNDKFENIVCKYNPALCEDENDVKLAQKPKKPSLSVNRSRELAALLNSLQGSQLASHLDLSRDGDETEPLNPVYLSVPTNQPIPVHPSVLVSHNVPVSQPVLVNQVDPSQYKVGVPVSVKIPVLQIAPVNQLDSYQYKDGEPVGVKIPVLQTAPINQVDPKQYAVDVPETVKIPVLHLDVPVSQNVPVNQPLPVSLRGSFQGPLGSGLGLKGSVNNLESNNYQRISADVPLQANDGPVVSHDDLRPDGDFSRRFGGGRGRRPYNYGAGRKLIPMVGANYSRRPY